MKSTINNHFHDNIEVWPMFTFNADMTESRTSDGGDRGKWIPQQIQLPDHLAANFREYSKATPGGIKHSGTAAIAFFMSMPQFVRDELVRSVGNSAWEGPIGIRDTWVGGTAIANLNMMFTIAENEGVNFNEHMQCVMWVENELQIQRSAKEVLEAYVRISDEENGDLKPRDSKTRAPKSQEERNDKAG
jgi:hypothetical protein